MTATILVVAKAPVPGQVKTRLIPAFGPDGAAHLAAAALLDTLAAAKAVPGARCAVALAGDLTYAVRAVEIRAALRACTVFVQVEGGLGTRLAAAHATVGIGPVVQIGMDTPQVTPTMLAECLRRLETADAALGRAYDGGWWALGLHDGSGAHVLPGVPMSMPTTGDATLRALRIAGLSVAALPPLRDVDVLDDVNSVFQSCSRTSEFARVAMGALR